MLTRYFCFISILMIIASAIMVGASVHFDQNWDGWIASLAGWALAAMALKEKRICQNEQARAQRERETSC